VVEFGTFLFLRGGGCQDVNGSIPSVFLDKNNLKERGSKIMHNLLFLQIIFVKYFMLRCKPLLARLSDPALSDDQHFPGAGLFTLTKQLVKIGAGRQVICSHPDVVVALLDPQAAHFTALRIVYSNETERAFFRQLIIDLG
jgi:hypothetical protein